VFIDSIDLVNFRNISRASLSFSRALNLFIGMNGQGKTNLLEAISFFSLGRSFRSRRREEMITFGEDYAFLAVRAESDNGITFVVEVGMNAAGAVKVSVNGKRVKGMSDFVGTIPAVIFTPEDIALAGGSPQIRRLYIDYTAAQIFPRFVRSLKRFKRILRQRNAFLKGFESAKDLEEKETWDEAFIEVSTEIVERRREALKKILPRVKAIFEELNGEGAELNLDYICSFNPEGLDIEAALRISLESSRDAEQRKRFTVAGPQNDDILLKLGGAELRRYGSQGQKRIVSIALKLAQAVTIMEERGERPVVLLDDIFSELDKEKSGKLKGALDDRYQVFVTTPREEDRRFFGERALIFRVDNGTIRSSI